MPVTVRLTFCGLPPSTSLIMIVPFLVPVAVGAAFTTRVQCAPAARVAPPPPVGHVLDESNVNSPGFVPPSVMLVRVSVAVALRLVSVTVFSTLVAPTVTLPKFSLVGETFTIVPAPFSVAVCVPLESLTAKVAGPSTVFEDGVKTML